MSVYAGDDSKKFERALESVWQNTVLPDQVVLVVDGHISKKLERVIEKYSSHEHFLVVKLETNVGLARALNKGLEHVINPIVVRADADDYNCRDRFEKQVRLLSYSNIDIAGSHVIEFDDTGRPVALKKVPIDSCSISKFVATRSPFNHMTVAFRLDVVVNVGGYPNIYLKEDYALWAILISRGYKTYNIDEVLVHASGDKKMYERRGGVKYIKSEFGLRKLLIKLGINSWPQAILIGFMRSFVFLLPSSLRGLFYIAFLRDKIS